MYWANQTRPDIVFTIDFSHYSAEPTIHHWNVVQYLRGTVNMGLYFPYNANNDLVGYANAGYLLDTDEAKSQSKYVFLVGRTTISRKGIKQTLTTKF